jgi:hypothetical protein
VPPSRAVGRDGLRVHERRSIRLVKG